MRLLNLRYGFATNSSSSHSIVIVKDPSKYTDDDYTEECYGWEDFTLTSKESKLRYLGAQIISTLDSGWGTAINNKEVVRCAIDLFFAKLGYEIPKFGGTQHYGVDHQSRINIPMAMKPPTEFGELPIDLQFIQELITTLLKDDVVIFGGNDNTCDDDGTRGQYDPSDVHRKLLLDRIVDLGGNFVARKTDNVWTLFNKDKGLKIRMSFDDDKDYSDYRPTSPELVDLSITHRCAKGCPFCYQHSSIDGAHADFGVLVKIANELEKNKVFEVAIGGGEPLGYMDSGLNILDVCRLFKDRRIVPNVTTGNIKMLLKYGEGLNKLCGGIGYSLATEEDFRLYLKYKEQLPEDKIVFHIPLQIAPIPLIREVSNYFENWNPGRILFLGYKSCDVKPSYELDKFYEELDTICLFRRVDIGIDTCLASSPGADAILNRLCIPSYMYYSKEGVYSMYIDAVGKQYGESSFTPDMRPMSTIKTFDLVDAWDAIKK